MVGLAADGWGMSEQTVISYLTVDGARAALDFYAAAFEATHHGPIYEDDDGRIGHAHFAIGSTEFYISDEHPELGVVAPTRVGGSTAAFCINVGDVDAAYERALAHGGVGDRPPADQLDFRSAWLRDPFGHRWGLMGPPLEG